MSVLDRFELEASPLADLHALARELGIDGYRGLGKEQLIEAILTRQGGDTAPEKVEDEDSATEEMSDVSLEAVESEWIVEGPIELRDNGSALVHPSEGDSVYVTPAQVRRCELVQGDVISGPARPPRRSDPHPGLIRVDRINGQMVDEVVGDVRFYDLPVMFPSEMWQLGKHDEQLAQLDGLTPYGKGSRVAIVGPTRSGKSELVRKMISALKAEGVNVQLALAGVRPEEISEWEASLPVEPVAARSMGEPFQAQARAAEQAVEQGKRIACRGEDAVVIIDTLSFLHPPIARKILASARNIADGGSLTIIATLEQLVGGETTVIALDPSRAAAGKYPAIDLRNSGTIRSELLVGEEGAAQIATAFSEVVD